MTVKTEYFTKAVHAGVKADPLTGAIMTPIYQTSTYVQEAPGKHKGWDYSRAGNPTRDALETAYAVMEDANHGMAFSSGLAAEQAIIQGLLNPGDQVIVCDDVYGGTGRMFRTLFAKYGIEFIFMDLSDPEKVRAATTDRTKMLWVETPTNPTLKIIDIEAMSTISKAVGANLIVDNTFASPIFQSPLSLGADMVIHSTTKYIGGHSDIIGGAVMTSNDDLHEKVRYVQFAAGAVPSPMECFLLLRSLKTLAIRMKQHHENSVVVADFLAEHQKIKKVYYPGLKSHAGHEVAAKQMSGYAGMISFDLDGSYEDVVQFLQNLKLFELAESLGGVESLVNHPEQMTHASVPEALRKELGIGPNLIRLSCGIEAAQDLVDDLEQALRR